ncbi:hypothetical protein NLJ89_g8923 [Agrocybe chaxingu]|uniref:Fungal-type protein kinase domain-containing protein n=1 Tax=Agrocybe chaxingu TaxID=84603 RepID=A0A9W8JU03_9AGAR|nr:hypothetical protein NLJ89_g8923 [Agrocybe chaxingu]
MKSPNTVRAVVERKFDLKEMSIVGKAHSGRALVLETLDVLQHLETSVTGLQFVKAWAQIVRCHRGYGVLGNFDLSPTPSSTSFPSAFAEGTGTIQLFNAARVGYVPFVALELLKADYWKGKIPRRYQHELEALIWILLFVMLSYDDKALGIDHAGTHSWVTSDYSKCRKEKGDFLSRGEFAVQDSFAHQKALGLALIIWVHAEASSRSQAAYMQRIRWLSLLSRSEGTQGLTATKKDHIEEDKDMWKTFTGVIPVPRRKISQVFGSG